MESVPRVFEDIVDWTPCARLSPVCAVTEILYRKPWIRDYELADYASFITPEHV